MGGAVQHLFLDRLETEDVCGVVLTQILPFYDAQVIELLGNFEQAVYEYVDTAR